MLARTIEETDEIVEPVFALEDHAWTSHRDCLFLSIMKMGEAEDRNRADQRGQTADDERSHVGQHVELEQRENGRHRDQRTRLVDRADSPEYESGSLFGCQRHSKRGLRLQPGVVSSTAHYHPWSKRPE